jgi:protein-S-isoprenylcysteine O-methyltransferase Ste14
VQVFDDVTTAIWIVFWLYWIISARSAKRSSGKPAKFVTIQVVGALIVVILVRLVLDFTGHGSATNVRNPVLQGVGLVILLLGMAFAIWARVCLGTNWGMPMTRRADPELVRTGPYRYVRHPIYSGWLLGIVGMVVAVNVYWLVLLVLVGAFLTYSAMREERDMVQTFPDTYPDYKRSTKMLVPFVA